MFSICAFIVLVQPIILLLSPLPVPVSNAMCLRGGQWSVCCRIVAVKWWLTAALRTSGKEEMQWGKKTFEVDVGGKENLSRWRSQNSDMLYYYYILPLIIREYFQLWNYYHVAVILRSISFICLCMLFSSWNNWRRLQDVHICLREQKLDVLGLN